MHVVAFALWFKATLARNRNPKWIARELQLARGRNGRFRPLTLLVGTLGRFRRRAQRVAAIYRRHTLRGGRIIFKAEYRPA
jgi:hypothetical protein